MTPAQLAYLVIFIAAATAASQTWRSVAGWLCGLIVVIALMLLFHLGGL
jgi:hypothetical protein